VVCHHRPPPPRLSLAASRRFASHGPDGRTAALGQEAKCRRCGGLASRVTFSSVGSRAGAAHGRPVGAGAYSEQRAVSCVVIVTGKRAHILNGGVITVFGGLRRSQSHFVCNYGNQK
jgi:hypothetical protein